MADDTIPIEPLSAAHRATVRAETLVSIGVYAIIPPAIIRLIAAPPPTALTGDAGLLQGLVLGSGLATFMMTLVVTTIVRRRIAAGKPPPLARAALPAIVRWLPRPIVVRAVVVGAVAAAIFVPAWAAIVAATHLLPLGQGQLLLFNIVFGASVGLVMTPPVVVRAFADAPRT